MVFSAGDLCCASDACVLIDTAVGETAYTWDKIPHVTEVSFVEAVSAPTLVTSSTAGQEQSVCGSIKTTGNLAIACHGGTAPGPLCANYKYRLRWALNCDQIWTSGAVVATPTANQYFEAVVRITNVPVSFNIAANQAVIYNYSWELVEWVNYPSCQTASEV